MAIDRSIPARIVLRRPRLRGADIVVALGVVGLLYGVLRLGHALTVRLVPGRHTLSSLPTGLSHLPYDAAQSLLRMFIALALSTAFALAYGTAAARMRRAQKVLIPLLDILQSVPILGFLTFTVAFFVNAFRGNVLGLECASIFAVFTSQAWNMTFSIYQSLTSQPRDLDEAARMYRLTKWQRFWKLDVPSSMIGLVWNAMMSMGGGWFFLTASEAITVGRHSYVLPGIGSYVGEAIAQHSIPKVLVASAVMVVLVVGVNFVFFRPLVAWSERFRTEDSEVQDRPRSVVLELLRRSTLPRAAGRVARPVGRALDRATRPLGLAEYPLRTEERRRRAGDVVFWAVVVGAVGWGAWACISYLVHRLGLGTVPYVLGLGLATFARVVVVVAVSTVVWVPVGVAIGMSPRLSRYAQPVVQVLASFPANVLFPFAVIVFLAVHLSLQVGSIVLMLIGAQWYILFNAIAGASAIPNDLREMTADLGLGRRLRWRRLILPAIFPSYVTGGITAAGGAWNASIVAEVTFWGTHRLHATGLGAYITDAATSPGPDHFARVLIGVVVMSAFVVVVNRLLWRRLYRMASGHFTL